MILNHEYVENTRSLKHLMVGDKIEHYFTFEDEENGVYAKNHYIAFF